MTRLFSRVVSMVLAAMAVLAVCGTASRCLAAPPVDLSPELISAEERRIEVVARVCEPTIAIFEASGTNGGSGVLISSDGYAVTNYHVVQPCGPGMTCGLSDGRVYEAVLVGLDPTGDIALIKLLGSDSFPAAKLGDSDAVQVGDPAIVVGNPFLLAEDFTPTVTYGIISGTHRYQYPAGTLLEYSDCLQTDAAINPGNSGGPLFDAAGRLIGINGRGSFEKRGRVNVGIGYAVSINQVKRFLPQLRAGRVVDHAMLGATVVTQPGPRAIVDAIDTTSDAYRRGLRKGDEIVSLGERDITSANELLNAIGCSPAGWRTKLGFRHRDNLRKIDVRLAPLHAPGELREALAAGENPTEEDSAKPGTPLGWKAAYEQRIDYANYYFNRKETERLVNNLPRFWFDGELTDDITGKAIQIKFTENQAIWVSKQGRYRFDARRDPTLQLAPPGAPGLLAGLWVGNALARDSIGAKVDEVYALGQLPWIAGQAPADVLVATLAGMRVEFYIDSRENKLLGMEVLLDEAKDPMRFELSEHTVLPQAKVKIGERLFADLKPHPHDKSEGKSQ